MDLTALTARLNSLAGFDLSAAEACELLNEAQVTAARRSRYPRKTIEAGPTVAEQAAYGLPPDFLLPISVSVAGYSWAGSDRETVRQYERSELAFQGRGVYYEGTDEEGNRALYLYPAPSGGDTLELEYVYSPTPLNVDEPSKGPDAFPSYWHSKLRFFVAEEYFAEVEDNPELAEVYRTKGDAAIADLWRYDNERSSGSGVFEARIPGVNA